MSAYCDIWKTISYMLWLINISSNSHCGYWTTSVEMNYNTMELDLILWRSTLSSLSTFGPFVGLKPLTFGPRHDITSCRKLFIWYKRHFVDPSYWIFRYVININLMAMKIYQTILLWKFNSDFWSGSKMCTSSEIK